MRAQVRRLVLDPRSHAVLLGVAAALIMLSRAGVGPLANYDDAYYAEKAKQMLHTGDWLTPRFAGVERLDNPPLFLWLMAGSFAVLGVTSFAAVLWSALAGVACVVLTHRLARELGRGDFEAWSAGVVLLGTGYFLKYANHAMFDVFLTALFLLLLLAYRRAWRGSAAAWALVGVCAGLGVLTKSVLGVFPLVVVGLHTLVTGRAWRALREGAWLAPLAATAVIGPWYGYQLATHHDAFIREHIAWLLVQRGLGTGHEAASPSSPLGYVTELGKTYWPWLPLALAGLWFMVRDAFGARQAAPAAAGGDVGSPADAADALSGRHAASLVLLWLLVVIGVLSAAHEKKLWYIMSAFPALALCSARGLGTWVRSESARARVVLGGFTLVFAAGAFLALTPIGGAAPRRPDLQVVARAARAMVSANERIVLMGGSYFAVAHQFVFASDRLLVAGPDDPAALRDSLVAGRWALVSRDGYARLAGADSLAYPAVVSCGKWRLVHRAPAPAVTLEPANAFE